MFARADVPPIRSPQAKINAKDPDGRTCLYVLALENKLGMARFFLDHGAYLETSDAEGRTPLHVSAWQVRRANLLFLTIFWRTRKLVSTSGLRAIHFISKSNPDLERWATKRL